MNRYCFLFLAILVLPLMGCPSEDDDGGTPAPTESLRLSYARLGSQSFANGGTVGGSGDLVIGFSAEVSPRAGDLFAVTADGAAQSDTETWNATGTEVRISVAEPWQAGLDYVVASTGELTGTGVNPLSGVNLTFDIFQEPLRLTAFRSGSTGFPLSDNPRISGVSVSEPIELEFSHPVTATTDQITLRGLGAVPYSLEQASDNVLRLTPTQELRDFTVHNLALSQVLGEDTGRDFDGLELPFFTGKSATPDFPVVSDEELLTLVQEQTFRYFWDFAEPNSGMARERNTSGNLVTSGGSGFGLMAMIVGVKRGFITQAEAIDRWKRVVSFLETADRFHGAWSHWINGTTGAVIPFSPRDNGGDLVETAFLVQGLLTVRQYLRQEAAGEAALINRIDALWRGVEWDWYTNEGDVILWHWSPDQEFAINLRIQGHNETQIVYTLAAASPTHPVGKSVYDSGYARNGNMQNGGTFFGTELPLGEDRSGPLFFTHYSYLGMDPRELVDEYANYQTQNINHSLINHAYCVANPRRYFGYSAECWGLTASDGEEGYSAHSPNNDRGIITPTAALSSMPYTPDESMAALRHFYYDLGDRLWGEYGFYDSFRPNGTWTANSFLAIDQGPIIVMLENHRTGLLWDLYMSAPEVTAGLDALGFTY